MIELFSGPCPICANKTFTFSKVLWPELISAWQLSPTEVDYINRQQGYSCMKCGNNLRSMALADAIMFTYGFSGSLEAFVGADFAKSLKVLEINDAGGLSSVLKKLPNHQLVHFPKYDMTNLAFESNVFDLVVHSDTLEHVPNPIKGLSECRRVLNTAGHCIFTVPIIVGRMTRSRTGLKKSYHGCTDLSDEDYAVHTEFGADMWKYVLESGFSKVRIHSFEYPSALVIEASGNNA